MSNHDNRRRNYLRQRNFILKCFFVVLTISAIITCGVAYASMIRVEKKSDTQTEDYQIDSKNSTAQPSEFNEDDTSTVNKTKWNLLLVNPWNKLPDNFSVDLTYLQNGQAVDKRAYPYLQEMMDDARREGLTPVICSSFRTREKQQTLFDNQVQKNIGRGYSKRDAETETARWIAVPGTSEHQSGLAVDIVASGYQLLNERQAKTPEQKWLMENSYKYGFILRYAEDKIDITGIGYEPWHYRYVGKEDAKKIYESGVCLEEYLNN